MGSNQVKKEVGDDEVSFSWCEKNTGKRIKEKINKLDLMEYIKNKQGIQMIEKGKNVDIEPLLNEFYKKEYQKDPIIYLLNYGYLY